MLTRRATPRVRLSGESLVRFRLRDARFFVRPERISEVARLETYTPLPCTDPANLGVILHRERVIPLVDLGPRLGILAGPVTLPTLCVILRTDLGEVASPVDEVLGLMSLASGTPPGDPVLEPERFGECDGKSAAG